MFEAWAAGFGSVGTRPHSRQRPKGERTDVQRKSEEERARALIRAIRAGSQFSIERAYWGQLSNPDLQGLAAELPLPPDEGSARMYPKLEDSGELPSLPAGPIVPPSLMPDWTIRGPPPPPPKDDSAEALRIWQTFNRIRVERLRTTINIRRYLNDIAGCLGYLRLPLEPMAFLEVSSQMAHLANELAHLGVAYAAPKFKWTEEYMFARLTSYGQKQLLRNEENELINLRLIKKRERRKSAPQTVKPAFTDSSVFDSPPQNDDLAEAAQLLPTDLLNDSFRFWQQRERNRENEWSNARK